MPHIEIDGPADPPARVFADYPLPFRELERAWEGFTPRREFHRLSLGEWLERHPLHADLPALQVALTRGPGIPDPDLLQRHFYWSSTCFVRSFHLFLSYLVLEAQGLYSWGVVTGYYSRFYFAKALANLWLGAWVRAPIPTKGPKLRPVLLYTGPNGVRLQHGKAVEALRPGESHGSWWELFAQLQHVPDFPEEDLVHVLGDDTFTHARREQVNYSDRWMEGFPELEWFDHTEDQMLAHAQAFRPRADRDFTDLDRYFDGLDPEEAEVSDFYTEEVQILWNSALCYLRVLGRLPVRQEFITRAKLIALSERALGELLPVGLGGIRRSLTELDLR
ncbi:MAG: hypothetical protein AVDCRST_MAG68-3357 [uncultured Gemmatimonadetes bacterium]|uniref:Uncharacterized protein n=1 Tax=uncultured Gemmatimonadota bacterium TaxID=203437 RepID=A0A6J4LL64_9BACT|nr:MAG: hypothetical protein AVDCRST_MAG68-3357 [uncultured Gemmatimonadota bacterium]